MKILFIFLILNISNTKKSNKKSRQKSNIDKYYTNYTKKSINNKIGASILIPGIMSFS